MGYKSSFGTRSIACTYFELGRRTSPVANFIAGFQFLLNKTKIIANRVVGKGEFRKKVKRAIRKYGKSS